jgi:hypothetical protein
MPPIITLSPLDVVLLVPLLVMGQRKGDTAEKRHTDDVWVALAKNACVNRMVQLRIGLTTATKANVYAGKYNKIAREVEESCGLVTGEINLENMRRRMYSDRAKYVAAMGAPYPFAGM